MLFFSIFYEEKHDNLKSIRCTALHRLGRNCSLYEFGTWKVRAPNLFSPGRTNLLRRPWAYEAVDFVSVIHSDRKRNSVALCICSLCTMSGFKLWKKSHFYRYQILLITIYVHEMFHNHRPCTTKHHHTLSVLGSFCWHKHRVTYIHIYTTIDWCRRLSILKY